MSLGLGVGGLQTVGDTHAHFPPAILDGKMGKNFWKQVFSVPITLF